MFWMNGNQPCTTIKKQKSTKPTLITNKLRVITTYKNINYDKNIITNLEVRLNLSLSVCRNHQILCATQNMC